MSERPLTDYERKVAKSIQRTTEDELGRRPKLTLCQRIVREADLSTPMPCQQRAAALYLEYESILSAVTEGEVQDG